MKICITNILQYLQLQERDRQYFTFKINNKIKITGKEQGLIFYFFYFTKYMHSYFFVFSKCLR